MFETYLKWIESHERLLLVAVAGVVLWFGYWPRGLVDRYGMTMQTFSKHKS